jgi:hypothetical protein
MNRREFFGAWAIVAVAAACKSNDAATADVHVSETDLVVADPDGVRSRARPEPVEQRPLRIGEEGEAGHVGYVPGPLAQQLAPLLDSGGWIHGSAVEVRGHREAPDKQGLTVALRRVEPI